MCIKNKLMRVNTVIAMAVMLMLMLMSLPMFSRVGFAADHVDRHDVKASWRLQAIESASVTTDSEITDGEAGNVVDATLLPRVMFKKLNGTTLKIRMDEPRVIHTLGILRPGWSTWSSATKLDVRVNSGPAERIDLLNSRIAPNTKSLDGAMAHIITIGKEVRTIEITVVDTESVTEFNTVGTIEILEALQGPDVLDFAPLEGVSANSSGINLHFDHERATSQVGIKLHTGNYPFRRIGAQIWSTMINHVPAGQQTVTIPWGQFQNPVAPQLELNALNAYKIEVHNQSGAGVPGLKSWSFVNSGTKLKPAWEQITTTAHPADENGWRAGVPADGFGRFGWTGADGLLVGNLTNNSFDYMMINRENDGRRSQFGFYTGAPNRPKQWTRRYVNWTGVVHQVLYGEPADKSWAIDTSKKPMPTSLTYSSLVPGFLIDSDDTQFSFGLSNDSVKTPQLLYKSKSGLQWVSAQEGVSGEQMTEGWLVAVWPSQPQMPVMFAPKHKPERIHADGAMLVFEFPEAVERMGVGTPSGFRWWDGQAGKVDQGSHQLAKKSKRLASILRAYPKSCEMKFKDDDSSVRIRETFSHVVWDNDWQDDALVIAPVSPLLSFAADTGYPVKLPGDLNDAGIPTKVGPYRYAEGTTVEYELPLPPTAGRMYLRPAGEHTLADDIAAKLTQSPKRSEHWLRNTSNIAPWMVWTSRSWGLTLMDDQQRHDFIDSWKIVFDDAFKPHPWYLRTEPWSGKRYIYSFAWLDVTNRTFGDINSGHGAILYASNLYARASGDWEMLEKNWALLNAVMEYYKVHHDWCYMQAPCHESTGDSAFDMDLIGYLGAVGYMRTAEALGKEEEAAIGRLLVARFSVPLSMRWLGAKWVAPDLSDSVSVPFSSPGITDSQGFVREQSPNWKIGLSLSWKGPSPEAFMAQIWGCGEEFWKFFEYDLIEKIEPSLWTEKNWYRPKNVVANLYMRGLLGAPSQKIIDALDEQGKTSVLGLSPKVAEAREYAPVYAMAIGMNYPVVLKDWGHAALLSAEYDESNSQAVIKFDSKRESIVTLEITQSAKSYVINGIAQGHLDMGNDVQVKLPTGKTTLEINF